MVNSIAAAANKVVVVPLGSGAKGTDGQLQYNDNGTTAGAEIYYDKVTGKLQTSGEVRTVDNSGGNRLWGQGRPGTSLRTHQGSTGYCTTASVINFALSYHMATWLTAAEVCPAGTWVCSINDLSSSEPCNIVPITLALCVTVKGTFTAQAPPERFYLVFLQMHLQQE